MKWPVKPRKVSWTNAADIEACILGLLGLSSKAIAQRVDLTKNQINYRLHKAGVRRVDYRNGVSSISKLVENATYGKVKAYFKDSVLPVSGYSQQNKTMHVPKRPPVRGVVRHRC